MTRRGRTREKGRVEISHVRVFGKETIEETIEPMRRALKPQRACRTDVEAPGQPRLSNGEKVLTTAACTSMVFQSLGELYLFRALFLRDRGSADEMAARQGEVSGLNNEDNYKQFNPR